MELLPSNASPLKLYNQAKRILRTTSRAKEPDWYKPAHELNLQWHIWVGSHSNVSAIYSRALKQWWTGPDLPTISVETDESGSPRGLGSATRDAIHELVRKILAAKEFGAKVKSLGVIIHLADGIRIRELAPDFAVDDDFDSINELLISAPDIALGDDSVDNRDGKWRILPLAGVQTGPKRSVAVQVSSRLALVADEIRRYGEMRNIPVVVNTRSALLESLSGLAYVFPEIQSAGAGSTLVLIQYENMTLLFAIGIRGDLQLVRPLMHRGTPHLTAAETQEVLTQTAALLNVKDATIVHASVTGLSEAVLLSLLESYREQFPNARINCFDLHNCPLTEEIPGSRFEFAVSVIEGAPRPDEAPFQSDLRLRWTRQDFYAPSLEESARMPQRVDLQLLKFSGIAQKLAFAAILAFCGWTGMDFFTKMRSEAWSLSPDDAQQMEQALAKLKKERREWQHWDQLLEKRSEGWLALETLLEIFPADGGVILRDANYRTELVEGKEVEASKNLGLKRVWDITGYANPEVAESLPTLGSRTRVAELLNGISEKNHAPYLAVNSQTRDLEVTLQQKQGSMPPSREFPAKVARHFRTSFELSISQILTSQDALAINISEDANP
jgi:hypothetical protein